MKTALRSALILILCLGLSSCWIPESFTATLNIDKNKHFKFSYEGVVTYGLALMAIKEKGPLSPKDETDFKRGEADLLKAGAKNAEYLGQGRFKISFQQEGEIESGKKIFLDLVQFQVGQDGKITVLGTEIDDKGRKELTDVNAKIDGTLKVTTDLTVVEQNAASTPYLGGWIGAYEWHVTLDQKTRPKMVLQP